MIAAPFGSHLSRPRGDVLSMKYLLASAAVLAVAGPACAQTISLKPVAEGRLRYEHADQEGLPEEKADALTVRARAGLTASSGALSATIVGQGTLALVDDYYDGVNGAATRPIVADPENIALYIAQLQYKTKVLTLKMLMSIRLRMSSLFLLLQGGLICYQELNFQVLDRMLMPLWKP